MKGVQCYELFGGIALTNRTFSFSLMMIIIRILHYLVHAAHEALRQSVSMSFCRQLIPVVC